jgi:hypothetical protein
MLYQITCYSHTGHEKSVLIDKDSPSFSTKAGESLLIPLKEVHAVVFISVIKKTSKIEVSYNVPHYTFPPEIQQRSK